MSKMVERVARAIYDARWDGGWDDADSAWDREPCWAMARAAIAAMREPSEAMKGAFVNALNSGQTNADGYRALIDAALQE